MTMLLFIDMYGFMPYAIFFADYCVDPRTFSFHCLLCLHESSLLFNVHVCTLFYMYIVLIQISSSEYCDGQ